MSFTNTPERYGVISAAFHWLSAIIVYGMFALGLWMVTLSYYDGWYHKAPELHKSIGILLMMGLVIRDRKSTRLNSSHSGESRMPSSA